MILDLRCATDLRFAIVSKPERHKFDRVSALWLRRPARPNLSKCGSHFNFLGFPGKPDRQSRRCLHQAGLFLTLLGSPEYLGERGCVAASGCAAKRRPPFGRACSFLEVRVGGRGNTGGLVNRASRKPHRSPKKILCDETEKAVLQGGSC